MFAIAPGTWFLSPLFVLGSANPGSQQISIRFQRKKFGVLRIRVQNASQEILLNEILREDIREWELSMACWPKGTYSLFLEDEEKAYRYEVLNR